jgi:hypothetical protein
MKRFISVSLAILLGLVSAADISADPLFLADTNQIEADAAQA